MNNDPAARTADQSGDDELPGQPWELPDEPPSPDGTVPDGDGTHRK